MRVYRPAPVIYTQPVYQTPVYAPAPIVYAPACATPAHPRPWVRNGRW